MHDSAGHGEAGFCEVDHTADWELEVWAPDLSTFLQQAAEGMYGMAGIKTRDDVRSTRRFTLDRPDMETALVGFLSELVYLLQTQHLAFDRFNFREVGGDDPPQLSVLAIGTPVVSIDKEIKAVTWHDIGVEETEDGLNGRITFDV